MSYRYVERMQMKNCADGDDSMVETVLFKMVLVKNSCKIVLSVLNEKGLVQPAPEAGAALPRGATEHCRGKHSASFRPGHSCQSAWWSLSSDNWVRMLLLDLDGFLPAKCVSSCPLPFLITCDLHKQINPVFLLSFIFSLVWSSSGQEEKEDLVCALHLRLADVQIDKYYE